MDWITVPENGLSLREVRTLTNRNVNLSEDLEKTVSAILEQVRTCLLYTSTSPRDLSTSRMPSSA